MARVAANGVTLNVTEIEPRTRGRYSADEVPVICVHGLAASSAFWYGAGAPFMALIGPTMLYDLRGHGKSGTTDTGYSVTNMVADLIALMDARGIRKAHLIAHSFGGMIVLLCALKHPERVASLTLADVRVRPIQTNLSIRAKTIPPALERRLEEYGIDLSAISQSDDGIGYLNAVAKIQVAAGAEATELLIALYRHPRLFKSLKNARKWIQLTENASLVKDLKDESAFVPADLKKIKQPILILVGQESPTLTSARTLARLCSHAILEEIPNAGHFFPASHPKLFLRPTLRFLRAVNRGDPRLQTHRAQSSA
ncbi:alpha/beta fold hydrolase [Actibacterium sp. D379-3]